MPIINLNIDRDLTGAEFKSALGAATKVMGRDTKSNVVFKGADAYVNAETGDIVLPALSNEAVISSEVARVARGFADHEPAHKRYTDLSLIKRMADEASAIDPMSDKAGDYAKISSILELGNAIEDVRIEYLACNDYSGVKRNLEATTKSVTEKFLETTSGESVPFKHAFGFYLAILGRVENGYDLDGLETIVRDMIAPEDRDFFDKALSDVVKCRIREKVAGTAETYGLAERLLKELFEHEAEKEAKNEESGNGDESGEGEEGEGSDAPNEERSSDGNDANDESGGDSGEGRGENDEGEEGNGNETGDSESGEGDEGNSGETAKGGENAKSKESAGDAVNGERSNEKSGDDPTKNEQNGGANELKTCQSTGNSVGLGDSSTSSARSFEQFLEDLADFMSYDEVAAAVLSELFEDIDMPTGTAIQYDESMNEYFTAENCRKLREGSISSYEHSNRQIRGKISTMSRKLERALLSKQNRDWQGGKEFGRLDAKRLVNAVNGERHVYRLRDDIEEVDTAVTLLIDLSGSMSGSRINLAQTTAIALAQTLERCGVAYNVVGFKEDIAPEPEVYEKHRKAFEGDVPQSKAWDLAKSADITVTYEPTILYEFKNFTKRLPASRASLGLLSAMAYGSNNDGVAVRLAGEKLLERPESRKVMIVLSDGQPAACGYGSNKAIYKNLISAVDWLESKGVVTAGIGIESRAVKEFYKRCVVLNNAADLGAATFDQLAKVLLGDRFKVDNSKLTA